VDLVVEAMVVAVDSAAGVSEAAAPVAGVEAVAGPRGAGAGEAAAVVV
jgi:hypothetical protein